MFFPPLPANEERKRLAPQRYGYAQTSAGERRGAGGVAPTEEKNKGKS